MKQPIFARLLFLPTLLLLAVYAAAEDWPVLRQETSAVSAVIDGKLNEAIWQNITGITDFVVIEPGSLKEPAHKTEIRLFYTERGLYAGVSSYQPTKTLVRRLSSRDELLNRDHVSITLDSSGAGLYGNWFSVNLGDSLSDGAVRPERLFSTEWDGPWRGASAVTDFGWTAEYFLPWSMMAMPKSAEGFRRMGFYLSRKVAYLDERWSFPALPPTKPRFMSVLQGLRLESVHPGQQFSFQPFYSADYGAIDNKERARAGADLFWRPASNFQLSASIKPDFGTVEADDVVVDLSAFEVFFNEKRPFFLEGQDIFITSQRVNSQYNRFILVNTRRIGAPVPELEDGVLSSDLEEDQTDLLRPVDLYGAAKLTGQAGNIRYGVLAAFEEDESIDILAKETLEQHRQRQISGQRFGVFRVLYENRSASGYRALGWIGTSVQGNDRNAYVQGVDGHYLSPLGAWKIDAQALYSKVAGRQGAATLWDIVYVPRQGVSHSLFLDWFDEDFEVNDLGYIRRSDRVGTRYRYQRTRSDLRQLHNLKLTFEVVNNWNNAGRLIRSGMFFTADMRPKNLHTITLDLGLFPARWEDTESLGNGDFKIENRGRLALSWESDSGKRLVGSLKYTTEGQRLGNWEHRLRAGFTAYLFDRLSVEARIEYRRRNEWLLYTTGRQFTTYNATSWHPNIKAQLFFTARSDLSMTLQWAGVDAAEHNYYQVPAGDGDLERVVQAGQAGARDFTISNFVWQTRYRWEFAPLSELVIVYNRAANLSNRPGASFGDLFSDAFDEPLLNTLIVRVRHRFGA